MSESRRVLSTYQAKLRRMWEHQQKTKTAPVLKLTQIELDNLLAVSIYPIGQIALKDMVGVRWAAETTKGYQVREYIDLGNTLAVLVYAVEVIPG